MGHCRRRYGPALPPCEKIPRNDSPLLAVYKLLLNIFEAKKLLYEELRTVDGSEVKLEDYC